MTTDIVSSSVSNITLFDGDVMSIVSGGTASSTQVSSGGREVIFPFGTAMGTTISHGGEQNILSDRTASGVTASLRTCTRYPVTIGAAAGSTDRGAAFRRTATS